MSEPKKRKLSVEETASNPSQAKVKKVDRKLTFDENVKFYFFPRKQGNQCVPMSGGTTLAMDQVHESEETLSFQQLEELKPIERKNRVTHVQNMLNELHSEIITHAQSNWSQLSTSSCQTLQEYYERLLFTHPNAGILQNVSSEDHYWLQPFPPKMRKMLLRDCGIDKLDANEKFENKYWRYF